MGVRGLTSFCDTIVPYIFNKTELSVDDPERSEPTAFVVDALAFLFATFSHNFGDSVFGGEYASFVRFTLACIQAWRAVGLKPIFVFDGATPENKVDTVAARVTARARQLALFMNSSDDSRTSVHWQTTIGFMPPLIIDALFEALKKAGVDIVIAPEEADALVVALAGELGGYAVSKDSDLLIYDPPSEGYKGYVPIETLAYVCEQAQAAQDDAHPKLAPSAVRPVAETHVAPPEDDGFTAVPSGRKGKRGNGPQALAATAPAASASLWTTAAESTDPAAAAAGATGSAAPLILTHPPPLSLDPSSPAPLTLTAFTFSVYKPANLAYYFKFPAPLLPLFGAALGNDYSHPQHFDVLFTSPQHRPHNDAGYERPREWQTEINAMQRTELVARAVEKEWTALQRDPGRLDRGDGRDGGGGGANSGSWRESSRVPAPGSPGPWRRGAGVRLGSGRGTPPLSPMRNLSTSGGGGGGGGDGGSAAGLDSSFVSIRSIGSTGFTPSSGLSTPRARGPGSEWGGASTVSVSGSGGLADEDDGASVVSETRRTALDPVRVLANGVMRRIVANVQLALDPKSYGASEQYLRKARAQAREGEGSEAWNAVLDLILEGTHNYTTLMQQEPEAVRRSYLARFTAHLTSSTAGPHGGGGGGGHGGMEGSTILLDSEEPDARKAERLRVMEAYSRAFRESRLFNALASILFNRLYVARFVLDDPDAPSVVVGPPRELRRWVYAILFGAFGLEWARDTIDAPEEQSESDASEEEEEDGTGPKPVKGGLTSSWIMPSARDADADPDELILVQTPPSASSYADTDEGEDDEEEDGDEEPKREQTTSLTARARGREQLVEDRPAPVVVEMVRRGEHCAHEAIPIESLADLFAERKFEHDAGRVFAQALQSYTTGPLTPEGGKPSLPRMQLANADTRVRELALTYILRGSARYAETTALAPHLRPLALALRFLLLIEGERWGVSAPKHNWQRHELEAAAYAGSVGLFLWREHQGEGKAAGSFKPPPPAAADRSEAARRSKEQVMRTNRWAYAASFPQPPKGRAIQLSSMLQSTLEMVHMLRQALLLVPLDAADECPPHACHEGPLFHAHLTGPPARSAAAAAASAAGTADAGGADGDRELYTDAQIEAEVAAVLAAVLDGVDEGIVGRDLDAERKLKKKRKKAEAAAAAAGAVVAVGVDVEDGGAQDGGGGRDDPLLVGEPFSAQAAAGDAAAFEPAAKGKKSKHQKKMAGGAAASSGSSSSSSSKSAGAKTLSNLYAALAVED